jgi:hypothetical protein
VVNPRHKRTSRAVAARLLNKEQILQSLSKYVGRPDSRPNSRLNQKSRPWNKLQGSTLENGEKLLL